MIVIGVLGGIASGKSVVTEQLRTLGAEVLDVDRIGHDVLLMAEVKRQIRKRWGDEVFGGNGEVVRQRLANIVFDPEQPAELTALESITHPPIESLIRANIRKIRERNPLALVLDAPVMVKTGWYRLCDLLLFVDCPAEARLRRALSRGWTAEMLAAREASQADVAEKQKLATHLVSNQGTLEQLNETVRQFWNSAIGPAGPARVETG